LNFGSRFSRRAARPSAASGPVNPRMPNARDASKDGHAARTQLFDCAAVDHHRDLFRIPGKDVFVERGYRDEVPGGGVQVSPTSPHIEATPDWEKELAASVGFFVVLRALLPRLREGAGSSVVALTSAALRRHTRRDVLGVAPKAAIEALVRATAVEEGRFGIRANSVAVGMIDAGITTRLIESGDLPPATMEQVRRTLPLQRFGTPEDIAEVVGFLASERSAFVTGQSIAVDGGGSV
jgi:NAD(P)-dependent dehydrogenase (short-subunit alcohol dehydrogenase family)